MSVRQTKVDVLTALIGACLSIPDDSANSEDVRTDRRTVKARQRRVAVATRRSRNIDGGRYTGFAAEVEYLDRLPGGAQDE